MAKSKIIRLAILEDDSAYGNLLIELFSSSTRHQCIRVFNRPVSFLGTVQDLEVDVLLLDINLPKISGIDCIRELKKSKPGIKVIMLTVHDDDSFVLRAFLEGADGYLLKDDTPAKIFSAIEEALTGGAPMSASIARKVIELLGKQSFTADKADANRSLGLILTNREMEVLSCMASGQQYSEAAAHLGVSLATIKTHIHHIYEKLHVKNKAEAIAKFLS